MQHKFSKSIQALTKIQSQNDRSKFVRDLEINRDRLKIAESSLKNAKDRWDFESIHQDILDLKWSIQQAENLIATPGYMSRIEKFTVEEAETVVQQFNEEMKAVVKQYDASMARLNKVVLKDVEELQTIANELKMLEKQRLDVVLLRNYLPKKQQMELMPFPLFQVTKSNLVRVTAGEQVQSIINLLKEMEVSK
ncbi:hypothetical protein [Lysinibacillus sphaericus]|uniref:Uncharacterized protein n=1 Tax=Lysinibacillus sphaericus OT4b.31 TaxID=1285586 RepID=R7ZIM0_LYSSH|nr:hypothetical protein [Lysinibacillus sphaericus]EON73957.1 hypothetical protein H131_04819 [Lysinibacillus sphaericus OT4b.31]